MPLYFGKGKGGLMYWVESAGVFASKTWSRFTPKTTETNADAIISPKGSGALIVQIPDGAASGGNARGLYALDFQRSRTNATQVASGTRSLILSGTANKATQEGTCVVAGTGHDCEDIASIIVSGKYNVITVPEDRKTTPPYNDYVEITLTGYITHFEPDWSPSLGSPNVYISCAGAVLVLHNLTIDPISGQYRVYAEEIITSFLSLGEVLPPDCSWDMTSLEEGVSFVAVEGSPTVMRVYSPTIDGIQDPAIFINFTPVGNTFNNTSIRHAVEGTQLVWGSNTIVSGENNIIWGKNSSIISGSRNKIDCLGGGNSVILAGSGGTLNSDNSTILSGLNSHAYINNSVVINSAARFSKKGDAQTTFLSMTAIGAGGIFTTDRQAPSANNQIFIKQISLNLITFKLIAYDSLDNSTYLTGTLSVRSTSWSTNSVVIDNVQTTVLKESIAFSFYVDSNLGCLSFKLEDAVHPSTKAYIFAEISTIQK